jgi:phage gpG-like protein
MSDIKFKINMPPIPGDLLRIIQPVMKENMFIAERDSKINYLSGPRPHILGVISGRLRNSIKTRTRRHGNVLEGSIGTNVKYGPIHEFGGSAGRNRKVMIPPRPFLRPSIEDNLPLFEEKFLKAIEDEWNKE